VDTVVLSITACVIVPAKICSNTVVRLQAAYNLNVVPQVVGGAEAEVRIGGEMA
jgi:starvation-inducible outer membrane lipoprotein